MTRIRRGNYIFKTWIGDHQPRHVHIYRDGRELARWDLDGWEPMEGRVGRRIVRILSQLRHEGKL